MIVPGLGDLPVFPCNLRKQPLIKGGFKSARKIEPPKHWPLTAVSTGSEVGFDALDIDPDGLDWLAANPLPATRAHRTRRGGWHFLLKSADGLTGSADDRISKGVHVRANGNYIIWWPLLGFKVRDAPLVEWAPGLLALAKSKHSAIVRETPMLGGCDPCGMEMRVGPASREARYAWVALRNAFDKLANEWPRIEGRPKRGGRNDLLNKLAYKMGGLVANGWIDGERVVKALMLAADECGLVREDGEAQCMATILSGLRAGMDRPYPPLGPWETLKPKHAANMGVSYTEVEIEGHVNRREDKLGTSNGER